MKVDEKVREELIRNIEENKNRNMEIHNKYIECIKNADTVEEIMKLKKHFLASLASIEIFPLTDKTCYFCLLHKLEDKHGAACEQCEYAVYHGVCSDENSDYDLVRDALDNLFNIIQMYYFSDDEDYDKAKEELEVMKNV